MLWLNGALMPPARARIDPADRGFTLGDGVFETLKADSSGPCHLDRHLARLERGAAVLGFAVPYDRADIAAAISQLLSITGLVDAVLRITLSRGVAPRGLLPPETPRATLMITAAPVPPPPGPARLVIARTTRRNEMSPSASIKSLNYLDSILARQEAARRGGDEAILLNTKGRVACATIATVFASLDGVLVTPPVAEGALPGIRRALLLEAGEAIERPITVGMLRAAGEIILANSLGLRPVATLDGKPVGDGKPGPIHARLVP